MNKLAFILLPLLMAGFIKEKNDNYLKSNSSNKNDPMQYDGPYVLYKNGKVYSKYILKDEGKISVKVDSATLSNKSTLSLSVLTDENGKTFSVKLKSELQNEKSDFPKVSKQFILSDIEGNFAAFRKLLQANNVIDTNFNWIFGDGHLVLIGDFVDRGIQQNEVLWLIYSLEEKAKAARGYVHFILGNHEIMNLNGDHRYLSAKYVESATLLNENFVSLYGEDSELGRWLRTKNVVEKIGDILFCHGGISAAVNEMDIPASKINKLVRPFLADSTFPFKSPEVNILYGDFGPFWYRGYYSGEVKATQLQIDSTLSAYKVKHIATGHTVIADTISFLYNGKIINTDVHHAKGHIEALLIEDGSYYRVTGFGERFQVFLK